MKIRLFNLDSKDELYVDNIEDAKFYITSGQFDYMEQIKDECGELN